jgi:hypothetical protein
MLLVLCLVLSINSKIALDVFTFLGVVILNYTMLMFGYLGEIEIVSRFVALFIGFVAFFGMFGMIYRKFIMGVKYNFDNRLLFGIYFSVWTFYGIFYMLGEEYKNIGINILDCIAKCLIGNGLWVYYTGIIVI